MPGYSGTPLPRKLGITEAAEVLLDGAPEGFELGSLPRGARVVRRPGGQAYPVIVCFARTALGWSASGPRCIGSPRRPARSGSPGRSSEGSAAGGSAAGG